MRPRRALLAAACCCCALRLTAAAPSAQAPAAAASHEPVPVLWRDPGSIAGRDLRWGPGAEDRQPRPPFQFLKEDLSGSKPKIRVRDAAGVIWNVKFAGALPEKNEVHAEVAANRLLWALGYVAEENYYLAAGRIEGVRGLERARDSIAPDGAFRVARFERREPDTVRTDRTWTLQANPFAGSRELSGLKILIALMNNWDNKPENTAIDQVPGDGGPQHLYLFSDWGASFGRMAGPPDWAPPPTRWRADHYAQQPLVRGVESGHVRLHYLGQVALDPIPAAHAEWFLTLAGQLQAAQLRDAFAAAGATRDDADAFARRVLDKLAELRAAVKSSLF